MTKKVAFMLAFIMFLNCVKFENVFALNNLTIEQAVSLAIENSFSIQEAKIDKIKKEIELKQAHEALKDARKKENTIKFSLLFNIQFPEKNDMPTEIGLIMKIPTVENELVVLEEQILYETLKVASEAESAFYDVMGEVDGLSKTEQQLISAKESLEVTSNLWKRGKAPEADVTYLESQIRDLETAKQKHLVNLDMKQKKLGSIIGREVRYGYNFTPYFPELTLERPDLDSMTAYALLNNFDLFKTIQTRKIAETEAENILQIYKSRYGAYINDIESYIRSHEGKTIDYDYFISQYNHTLTAIDSPWTGSFVINLIFFKIYIPKEWFKGELSGIRYMDDQKYALFVALVERDKARNAEINAIASLEDEIYQQYSTLKQMESSMETAVEALDVSKKDYDNKLIDNKRQLVTFTTLESAKSAYYESQSNLYEMKLDYANTLSSLNLKTGGYINVRLLGGDFTSSDLESGTSFMGTPTWKINQTITEYSFQFSVDIPDEFNVSKYELIYNGELVGSRLDLDEKITHLPLTYADSTLFQVNFYNDDVMKYKAIFDGGQFDGELLMEVVQEDETYDSSSDLKIWSISSVDEFRSDFSVNVKGVNYDSFKVYAGETLLGSAFDSGYVRTLTLYYSDVENLSVELYLAGKLVQTYKVSVSLNGANVLK